LVDIARTFYLRLLWGTIRRWENRRHSKKSIDWIKKKYWKVERKWDDKKHKYIQIIKENWSER
jgi:hypothetical protein